MDAGDAGAMLERLHDKSAWPMFTVPLGAGFSIVVHYKSGEEYTTTVVGVGVGARRPAARRGSSRRPAKKSSSGSDELRSNVTENSPLRGPSTTLWWTLQSEGQ